MACDIKDCICPVKLVHFFVTMICVCYLYHQSDFLSLYKIKIFVLSKCNEVFLINSFLQHNMQY